MFDIHGHEKAKRCYAWAYKDGEHDAEFITVLKIAPVDSPQKAFQAAVIAEMKRVSNG